MTHRFDQVQGVCCSSIPRASTYSDTPHRRHHVEQRTYWGQSLAHHPDDDRHVCGPLGTLRVLTLLCAEDAKEVLDTARHRGL